MAKKAPAIETVPLTSTGDVGNMLGDFTKTGANRAIQGNISGGRASGAELYNFLMGGGAIQANPLLAAQLDAETKQDTRQGRNLLNQNNKIQSQLDRLQKQLDSGRLDATKRARIESQISDLNTRLTDNKTKIGELSANISGAAQRITGGSGGLTDALLSAMAPTYAAFDQVKQQLDGRGTPGMLGQRFMDQTGQGFAAREVGRGAAGEALYGRATQMASSDGRLSPEAARDAVQSARQAFSARGLGTGSGAAAAELLNRDQYSRQRMFQDLGFANQIQQQDTQRQFSNEEGRRLGSQLNANLLGQAMGAEQLYQDRGLGASLQRMELETQLNPTLMALGMDPFGGRGVGTAALGPASTLAGTVTQAQSNERMFNANANNWGNWNSYMMNNAPMQSSGMGSAMGSLGGMALGAAAGAALAGPTFGVSVPVGMMLGASFGGTAGAGVGGLMGR